MPTTKMYTYTAPSGVTVTSVHPQVEDFPTVAAYLRWSYTSWFKKILKAYGIRV